MPRKKLYKKTTVEPIELEDEPEKDVALEDGDTDIQEALRSVPGGISTVKLYRILPQGGRPKFLTEMSPDMFSEASVQDTYGGGIYKIRARKNDGKWGWNTFEIEGAPKRLAPIEYDEEEEDTQPVQPVQQPTQQAPQYDPFMLMQMMQKAQEQGEQRILKMMEFMRPQQQSPDVTKQVFEIVEKIAPMMSGGEGGGSNWIMALSQFKEPILKIVDTIQVALTRPAAVPVQNPPSAPVQQSLNQPKAEDDMIGLLIRQALPVLINGATKNADPALYADMILDQVPETAYPKLAQWLGSPNCLEDLCKIEPGIRFQQEWWASLRETLAGALNDARTGVQPATDPEHSEN